MLNGNGNENGNKINESNFFAIVLQGYNAINLYGENVVFARQKFYHLCSCSLLLF